MERRDYKLPEPLAEDLEAHKRDDQTFPAFIRETVLPALEEDDTASEVTLEASERTKLVRAIADELQH